MTLGHSGPVLQGNSAGWVARGAGRGAGPARKPRPGRGQVSRGLSRAQVRHRRSCSQVRTVVRGKEPAWAQVGTQRGFWGWAHCSGGQAEAGRGAGPHDAARRRAGTPEPALAAACSRPLPHPSPYLTLPPFCTSARSSPTPPVLFPRTLPVPPSPPFLLPRFSRGWAVSAQTFTVPPFSSPNSGSPILPGPHHFPQLQLGRQEASLRFTDEKTEAAQLLR